MREGSVVSYFQVIQRLYIEDVPAWQDGVGIQS